MDTLQNYAQPSKACTNIRFAEAYIPEDHEYHINRNEFNCWIFQNHFDCVASAIAGGINSVFNCPRGSSLFSTKEIVHALDVIHCHFATQELENIQNEYPDEDWDSIKQVLVCYFFEEFWIYFNEYIIIIIIRVKLFQGNMQKKF